MANRVYPVEPERFRLDDSVSQLRDMTGAFGLELYDRLTDLFRDCAQGKILARRRFGAYV